MGQTVSVNSTNRAIYISSLDDSVSRIVVSNSGIAATMVVPEPGWTVTADTDTWMLQHRPDGVLTAHDGFNQTRIATLAAAISDAAIYTLYQDNDDDHDDDHYVRRPACDHKIDASALLLEMPALVLADRDAPLITVMQLHNAGPGPVVFTVSDGLFYVHDVNDVNDGNNIKTFTLHVQSPPTNDHILLTARNGTTEVSKYLTVRFVQPTHVDNLVRIAVNHMDRAELSAKTVDSDALRGPMTHIMMQLPDNINISAGRNIRNIQNTSRQTSTVIMTRADLDRAAVRMSGRTAIRVPYWLSMDNGLVYLVRNVITFGPMPCFLGNAVVCVGMHGRQMQWQQVCKLRPNDKVLDAYGTWQTVRRVVRSEPVDAVMVRLPAHCLNRNQPNKTLLLTTNHRIMAPDLRGHVRNLPAGQLGSVGPRSIRNTMVFQTPLYHIETFTYTFILVNNVMVETFRHS